MEAREWLEKNFPGECKNVNHAGQSCKFAIRGRETEVLESYAAPLREQIKELEAERETLRDMIQHPGDGSCDHCGKVPAIDIPTSLCDECRDGVKRAEKAESRCLALTQAIEAFVSSLEPQDDLRGSNLSVSFDELKECVKSARELLAGKG